MMTNNNLGDVSRMNKGDATEQISKNKELCYVSDIDVGDIEKLAYECGFIDKNYRCDNKFCGDLEDLVKFANAIRAEEHEACAKICDGLHRTWRWDDEPDSESGPRQCAMAIRQRAAQKDEVSE